MPQGITYYTTNIRCNTYYARSLGYIQHSPQTQLTVRWARNSSRTAVHPHAYTLSLKNELKRDYKKRGWPRYYKFASLEFLAFTLNTSGNPPRVFFADESKLTDGSVSGTYHSMGSLATKWHNPGRVSITALATVHQRYPWIIGTATKTGKFECTNGAWLKPV
jgi:hypothetical protein